MNSSSMSISEAIASLLSNIPQTGSAVEFDVEGYYALVLGLVQVQRMAVAQERELAAFRLLEAGRFASGIMDEVAIDASGALKLDEDGNVITVNFGRRS